MQNIISINSARVFKPFFNILFDIKDIINFYIIRSSSFLTCHYSEKYKNSSIKDNISQSPDDWMLRQKQEIIRYIRSKEPYWMLNNIVISIRRTIKEKVDIMSKLWQSNTKRSNI